MTKNYSPLETHIRRLIARHGPISVAEYMGLALGHPDYGYYRTRDPLGRSGDFITAPEISQMFGEMIGAWCMTTWQAMGGAAFDLIEFGPGRGTLMADLLRVVGKVMPEFMAAANLRLVETSPALRDRQQQALSAHAPHWHESIEDVPPGPAIYIMNEFLDALPIRQFVATGQGLAERCVGIDPESDRLRFVVENRVRIPFASPSWERPPDESGRVRVLPSHSNTLTLALSHEGKGTINVSQIGAIVETCPAALAIVREVSARIIEHGGAAVIVDYGYDAPGGEDTFQAVRNHAYADPLADPGEVDLTAHVDFAALAKAAREAGVTVQGPVGQGAFLLSLGIAERAARLGGEADAALHRLTAEDQMGELFKVLVLTK
jgi:SAM-dependent MidA family methyltransferase